jgi:hypothetical protein
MRSPHSDLAWTATSSLHPPITCQGDSMVLGQQEQESDSSIPNLRCSSSLLNAGKQSPHTYTLPLVPAPSPFAGPHVPNESHVRARAIHLLPAPFSVRVSFAKHCTAQPPIGSQMTPRGTGPAPTPDPPPDPPPDPRGRRKMYCRFSKSLRGAMAVGTP